jgi:hypothetical protein
MNLAIIEKSRLVAILNCPYNKGSMRELSYDLLFGAQIL